MDRIPGFPERIPTVLAIKLIFLSNSPSHDTYTWTLSHTHTHTHLSPLVSRANGSPSYHRSQLTADYTTPASPCPRHSARAKDMLQKRPEKYRSEDPNRATQGQPAQPRCAGAKEGNFQRRSPLNLSSFHAGEKASEKEGDRRWTVPELNPYGELNENVLVPTVLFSSRIPDECAQFLPNIMI